MPWRNAASSVLILLARRAGVLLLVLLMAAPAWAQGAGAPGVRRIALVIGNQDYRHVARLQNARADAQAFAATLRERGFEVFEGFDLDRSQMNRLFTRFEAALAAGTVGVFYYAGHGVQLGGGNVLLPVDIQAQTEREALDDGIPLPLLMERMASANNRRGGGLNLLIVDACRDNPFQNTGRAIGTTRGLVASGSSGVMVLYAAGTNQQALDRLGPDDRDPNGLFTRTLLRTIRQPGLPVREVVSRVRNEVAEAARRVGHEQIPAIYDEAVGDFVFTPAAVVATAPVAPPPPAAPPVASLTDREALFWQSIMASREAGDFEAYLRIFPDGVFAPLARNRIAMLRPAPPAAPPPAAPAPARPAAIVPTPPAAVAPTPPAVLAPAVPDPPRRRASPAELAAARHGLVALGLLPVSGGNEALDDAASAQAIQRYQRLTGRPETGTANEAELTALGEAGRRLIALVTRPTRSPRGVPGTSVTGASARFDRGFAADSPPAGSQRNVQDAAYWYGLAAQDGDPRAFVQLGLLHARGQGVPRDPAAAVLLWLAGAGRGDGTSLFNLGAAYEHGIGVTVDPAEARRWYRLAAEARHADANAALQRLGP